MLTSVFVQRTNSSQLRAAGLFVGLTVGAVTLICASFLVADIELPEWFVIAGRWLPALVTLLVLRMVSLKGGLAHWWALRPGGWRRLVGAGLAAVGALVLVYALSVLPVVLGGSADLQPVSALAQVAVLLVPMVLIFSLSTLGEEAAWRGFLQQALSGWGFWGASAAVAGAWVVFHVPLHGTMALQGTIPWVMAVTSTVGLFPLGLFLSAVVVRFGSVWPAVFAHALPFSALNLLRDVDDLANATLWVVAGVSALLVLGAAVLFAPRPGRS